MSNEHQKLFVYGSDERMSEYDQIITNLNNKYDLHINDLDLTTGSMAIVVGGDGSLNYFVNNVNFDSDNSILYLPCGTANDFAKSLGIEWKDQSSHFIESVLESCSTMTVPVALCNERMFLNAAVGGALSEITESGDDLLKKLSGKLSYYVNAVDKVFSAKMIEYEFICRDVKKNIQSYGFIVSQGIYAGGGAKITTNIVPNFNEHLNFISPYNTELIKSLDFALKIQNFEKLELTEEEHDRFINLFESEFLVRSDEELTVKLDGEVYKARELDFKKSEKKISFYIY